MYWGDRSTVGKPGRSFDIVVAVASVRGSQILSDSYPAPADVGTPLSIRGGLPGPTCDLIMRWYPG